MRHKLRGGEGATLAVLCLIAAALFLFPLAMLGRAGLFDDGVLTLAPVAEALQGRSIPRALWRSVESSAGSAFFALIFGTGVALLIGLTDLRRKGLYTFLILLPMMIPPHVTAIAWIQALGPSSPVLHTLRIAPELGATHPLYSREGVIFLLSVQHMPLVFLVVLAALRSLPRELSDAARVCGARPWALLRRIILPLLAPTLSVAAVLAFIAAMGNFGIPALLGIPARYTTLPVLIWRRLASFGPAVLTDVAVIASLLAGIAVVAILLQMLLMRRQRNALIGPPQPPLHIALGRTRPWAEGALALFVLIALGLPTASLIATALVATYGVPLGPDTITLDNFAEVLLRQSVTLRAFANSTLVAGAAAVAIGIVAIALARFLTAAHPVARRLSHAIAALAEMSYAIPGLVISIAFILAFIRPIPVIGVSIYGTLGLIFLAYFCAFFAIALKPVSAAFAQLDPALDDAARVAGAGFGRRMRRIFVPLVAPAAASGGILVFLTAYNEVTVSALLWSTGNETIGTTIFNYEDGGYTTLAAAMSTVTVVATALLMLLLDRLARRVPPGVIPWRI